MFEPLLDRPAAPCLCRLFLRRVLALIAFGERDQSLGRAFGLPFGLAVEDDVLARIAQFGIDRVIDVELPRVDARHVEPIGRAPSELQSLMRISYAVFCLKKNKNLNTHSAMS